MAPRLDPKTSNVSNDVIASFAIEAGEAKREIDEWTGRYRSILKRAKAEGVKTGVMLSVLRMKKKDEDEVLMEMRDMIRYASILAPNIKLRQVDLFEGLDTRPVNVKTQGAMQDAEAEQRGYDTALAGGSLDDSVYAGGTEAYAHFYDGFQRGQGVLAERTPAHTKKANPSRTKKRSARAQAQEDALNGTDAAGNA